MKKALKVSLFFIVGYFLSQLAIFFLSKDNFFKSPMYILLPIVGFFAFYFLTPYVEKYTEWNIFVIIITFLVISIISHYLVIYIYGYYIYVVTGTMPKNLGIIDLFLSSAFLPFVISSVIGMVARINKL